MTIKATNNILTQSELSQVYNIASNVIENLPPSAIQELLGGNEKDLKGLFEDILYATNMVVNNNSTRIGNFGSLSNFESSFDETLKIQSYNYFKSTMLPNFEQHWRNLEWANIVQLHPWCCFLCSRGSGKSYEFANALPLWRMWRYRKPDYFQRTTVDNRNSKECVIITNESRLGRRHLAKIVGEIESNELLHEILLPKDKRGLGKDKIETKNGASVELRSFGSFIRGLHVGFVIVDDFLDKSALYSQEQRDKFKETFDAEIKNIVEPYGGLVVSGCVNPNTYVLTQNGLRVIGDLCPNSDYKQEKVLLDYNKLIVGENGLNNASKYWCNGFNDTIEIETDGGYKLEGSLIHPIKIMNKDGFIEWKQFKDLTEEDYACFKIGLGFGEAQPISLKEFEFKSDRANTKYLNFGEEISCEMAYFMGLWEADGSYDKTKNGFTITKANEGIRKFVLSGFSGTEFRVRKRDEIKMDFGSIHLSKLFDYVGLQKVTALYKSIPSKIIGSDEKTIVSFLSGLFDGDGCFYLKDNQAQISLFSISEKLIDQTKILLLHLGILSSKVKRPPAISPKIIGKNNCYGLVITGYDCKIFMEKIGFLHSGKGDNKDLSFLEENNSSYRYIPNQTKIFKEVRKEKPRRERGKVSELPPFTSESLLGKRISRRVFNTACDWFVEKGAKGYYTDIMLNNRNSNYIFLKINKITKSQNWTVDFVIPNDHTFISNGFVSHNTPFFKTDLYGYLKTDPAFKVFEYPAIDKDGELLAPDRFNFKQLMNLKKSLGSIVFSREYLVSPISDASSIFPWEYLNTSIVGMENISLVDNIESFPVKMKRVVVGVDFAKSANVGSDFTVISVWGKGLDNRYYLIHIERGQGWSTNEQVSRIMRVNNAYRPNKIKAEDNGFQSVIVGLVRERGVTCIEGFTTTENKKDDLIGLPAISAMFERGEIKVPYKEGKSRDMANLMLGEFNSIGFTDQNKLQSVDGHDDICLSSWFALTELRQKSGLKIEMI